MPVCVEEEVVLKELLGKLNLFESPATVSTEVEEKVVEGKYEKKETTVVEFVKGKILYRFLLKEPEESVKKELRKRGVLCCYGRTYLY